MLTAALLWAPFLSYASFAQDNAQAKSEASAPAEAPAAPETRSPGEAPGAAQVPSGKISVQCVSFSVERKKSPDGRSWIAMRGEYTAVLQATAEEVLKVLTSYKAFPSIFPRIAAVEVLDDNGAVAHILETTIVRVLGLSSTSVLELEIRNEHPRPDLAVQTTRMLKSDGSVFDSSAVWTIETLAPEAAAGAAASKGPRCKVVYRMETWSDPRFPLQEGIMRSFGSKDLEDVVRQMAEAVKKNRGGK